MLLLCFAFSWYSEYLHSPFIPHLHSGLLALHIPLNEYHCRLPVVGISICPSYIIHVFIRVRRLKSTIKLLPIARILLPTAALLFLYFFFARPVPTQTAISCPSASPLFTVFPVFLIFSSTVSYDTSGPVLTVAV